MAVLGSRHEPEPAGVERHPTTGEQRAGQITGRSLAVGALGAVAVGIIAPYSIYGLAGSYMELDFSTPLSLFLLFALVAGPNLLLRRLRPRWALAPAELVAVYGMMLIASALVTMGLTSQLMPSLTGVAYYATPENHFADQLLPLIKPWLLPRGTSPTAPVIRYLYEGLPPGQHVPWGAWLPALLAWAPMLLALYLAMIAVMVLMRKQWVENERLAYPLTYLPLELIGARSGGRPTLLGQPLFWLGFMVPVFFSVLAGLHAYFPSVPSPTLAKGVELIKGVWSTSFRLSFPMLGFFYLVNTEVTFSLWSFNLLTQAADAALKFVRLQLQTNVGPFGAETAVFKFLGSGAFLTLFASNLWVARRHFHRVWERMAGRGEPGVDRDEIMSYPTAVWLLVGALVVMGLWLNASGIPGAVVPVVLLFAFAFFLGLTRIVVEAGMAEAVAPSIAPDMTAALLGTPALGPTGMVALALNYVWCSDIRTFVMASTAHSLRMTTVVRRGQGRLLGGFLIAIVLAFAASFWMTMSATYRQGAPNLEGWWFGSGGYAVLPYKWAAARIAENAGPSLAGWGLVGLGALICGGLTLGRFRFTNWPLHPIGFTLATTWIMKELWLTALLSWLIKSMILRYGGMRHYAGARPLFLGLILGQYAITVLWMIVDTLTGRRGIKLFWI